MLVDINRDPNGTGVYLFPSDTLEINPGFLVLVGCNGSGKSSLIKILKNEFKQNNVPVVSFNNLIDGGSHSRSNDGFHGNFEMLACKMSSSEGEEIKLNLGTILTEVGREVKNQSSKAKKLAILLDASDSGLSIDSVEELKDVFLNVVIPDAQSSGVDVYIIVAANEFEMCIDQNCLDVQTFKERKFKTYSSYRSFIMKSRDRKDSRVAKETRIDQKRRRRKL